MAIRKFLRRKKRNKGEGKSAPFFQGDAPIHDETHGHQFFSSTQMAPQTKLKVSSPGDPQEKEADKMADRVVHKKENEKEEVAKKDDEEKKTLQHKATGEKESLKRKDQEDPEKLHRVSKEEEKIAQKEAEEKQTVEENDHLHDRDQVEDQTVATKRSAAGSVPGKASMVAARSDGATALPPGISQEMSSSFGYDFSKVKIYKGAAAAAASERMGAQAFTYQGDVYFNENKFDPGSEKGRWLLAHELTHVVQQSSDTLAPVMKKDVPGFSMPVPEKFVLKKKEQTIIAAEGRVMGTKVQILPDTTGEVKAGKDGQTSIKLIHHIDAPLIAGGKITRAGGQAVITLVIQTTYREGVDPTGPSKFGRGTTADDKKAGTTTLRFHEGAHGERALLYLKEHPLPKFEGKTGDTVKAYDAAVADFKKRLEAYRSRMMKDNFEAGDCSGAPQPGCPK